MQPQPDLELSPELSPGEGPRRLGPRAWLALIVLVALAPLPALATRDLWNTDELRYTEAARQLGAYGHTVVPHLNGETYGEKPPGFFWSGNVVRALLGGDRVFGPTGGYSLGTRLACWLSFLGCTLLVLHLGRRLFEDERVGLLGAAVYASTVLMAYRSQSALIDGVLAVFVLAGLTALVRVPAAEGVGRKVGWTALSALALVAASLTKGPVGLLLAAIGAVSLGLVRQGRKGVSWSALGAVSVITLGATLLWLYAASLEAGDAYWDRMFSEQLRDRIVNAPRHVEPFYFYLAVLPELFNPWILLLPAAGVVLWRNHKQDRTQPETRAALGLGVWAGVGFLFFSLLSGKRIGYAQPLVPALALLVGYGVVAAPRAADDRVLRWLLPLRAIPWLCSVAGGAALLLAATTPFVPDQALARVGLEHVPAWTPAVFGLIGAVCLALGWTLRGGDFAQPERTAGIAALTGLVFLAAVLTVFPARNPERAVRPFAEAVAARVPEGATVVVVPNFHDGRISLYTGVERYEQVADLAEVSASGVWVVIRQKELARADPEVRERFELVLDAPRPDGKRGYALLRRR